MHTIKPALQFLAMFALCCLTARGVAYADETNPERTRTEITAMLNTFLTPAVNSTRAGHDRFWADDLVYTSSAGKVMSKADILKSIDEDSKAASDKQADAGPVFTAEDIVVRPYGNAAALTFRLVAREADGKTSYYRNSGMFLLRNGKWQAVTWQATRVAPEK